MLLVQSIDFLFSSLMDTKDPRKRKSVKPDNRNRMNGITFFFSEKKASYKDVLFFFLLFIYVLLLLLCRARLRKQTCAGIPHFLTHPPTHTGFIKTYSRLPIHSNIFPFNDRGFPCKSQILKSNCH
jgi:hypothetical protein